MDDSRVEKNCTLKTSSDKKALNYLPSPKKTCRVTQRHECQSQFQIMEKKASPEL